MILNNFKMTLRPVEHRNSLLRKGTRPSNGVFIDSKEEYLALAWNNPVFSIVCNVSLDQVVRRGHRLEANLESMRTTFPLEVDKLLTQYHTITVKIEMDKIAAVMNSTRDKYEIVNNHYNLQRDRLLCSMEEEIDRLKNQKAVGEPCLKEPTNNKHNNHNAQPIPPILCIGNTVTNLEKDVNWRALKLMQEWYNTHEKQPYPSSKDVYDISKKGNISVSDIKTWFQFERIRRSSIPP